MTEIPFSKCHLQGDMQLIQDLKYDHNWNLCLIFSSAGDNTRAQFPF